VGTVIAGRTDQALEELVGFFVNTLVLRTDVSGDPTFAELVERVREADLAAYAHQDVPFERLVEVLNPARSMARHPLFQVLLAFQNTGDATLDLEGLRVGPQPLTLHAAKFDLSFQLGETFDADGAEAGIEGSLEYATDLFDPGTARSLTERLVRLLDAVSADPGARIGAVDLTSEPELRELARWNDTALDVSVLTLPALFEAQARYAPDAPAVVAGEVELSYAQVNARANRLARYLVERGAGPESVVALVLPRSVDIVVAQLAVVKAGGAYLPVDPDYPEDRISYMLADAAPVLVLHEGELPQDLDRYPGHDLTDADRTAPLRPEHPAYVIYTSGSTGRPKGVVVTHRGLSNLFQHQFQELYPAATEGRRLRVALTAALSFDASFDPLLWMVAGHELHLIDDDTRRDPAALVEYTTRAGIDFLELTPAYYEQLLAHGLLSEDHRSRPHLIALGGEAVSEPRQGVSRGSQPGTARR
jgi:non-ribosomal peptide synthetase component F